MAEESAPISTLPLTTQSDPSSQPNQSMDAPAVDYTSFPRNRSNSRGSTDSPIPTPEAPTTAADADTPSSTSTSLTPQFPAWQPPSIPVIDWSRMVNSLSYTTEPMRYSALSKTFFLLSGKSSDDILAMRGWTEL